MFDIFKRSSTLPFLLLLLYIISNISSGNCADENITTTAIPPTDTPKTNITIIKVKDTDLCTKCDCYQSSLVLDCSYRNITEWFNANELNALENDNDYQFETINMEGNLLKEIPEFPALKNLRSLNFHKNQINTTHDGAFTKLISLKHLDLSYNLFDSKTLYPEAFRGKYNPHLYQPMKNLTHLNLAGNLFHSLKSDIFIHFPRIEILNLSSNPFEHIDDLTNQAISSLGYVTEIDLSNMGLSDLPIYLFNHHKYDLKMLLLNGNKFEKIPYDAIGKAINLENLYINNNPFINFDKDNKFPILPNLKELHISYCSNLTSIESGSLNGLRNLTKLFITNNPELKTIHANSLAYFKFNSTDLAYPPLEVLSLKDNSIEVLPKTLLENWNGINEIDLRNNPWTCTCKNDFLLNTLLAQIRKQKLNILNELNCKMPEKFNDIPLKNFNIKNGIKINCDNSDKAGLNDYTVITGMLIGILISLPLAFIFFIIYKRGCFGLLNTNDPGKFSRAFYSRTNNNEEFM